MNSILIVITTLPNPQEARTLAKLLIEERLAACVQIQPSITSIYRWNNQVCEENEVVLSIKTTAQQWLAVESYIQKNHPYDLPELIALSPSQYSKAYGVWVSEEVKEA